MHVSPKTGVSAFIKDIQFDLFALGAVLADPSLNADNCLGPAKPLRFPVEAMEADIDRLASMAPPPDSFVIPGGVPGAIYAHFARTVCRRAERNVVALCFDASEPLWIVAYLNRLGDWLFALAVAEDGDGQG
jgi:cob(I)alamin adenosyltransferase